MDPASYIAASGMKAQLRALNIASNNLANVESPGYKSDAPFYRMLQQSFGDLSGVAIAGTRTDFTAGSLKTTGNPLDLAINGEGFFTVRTPAGLGYTRNGCFSISPAGELVTGDGFQVLDRNGLPIQIVRNPNAANQVIIGKNGEVNVDDQQVATLNIVRFDDLSQLSKLENQIFESTVQPQQAVTPNIEQGALEASNANTVSTMLNLVEIERMYDMSSRTIQTVMNTINRRAIAEITQPA